MEEGHIQSATVPRDADESGDLGLLDRLLAGEFGQHVDVERFAQAQVLERVENRGVQLFDASLEQRCEFGGDRGAPAQLPDPVDLSQRVRLPGTVHEMPQEQCVPTGRLPHLGGRMFLQLPAEDRFDQLDTLLFGERRQRDTGEVVVLPQRRHGIGHRFTATDGRHDVHRPIDRELVQQGRGQLVEQVRIVDADDDVTVGEQ